MVSKKKAQKNAKIGKKKYVTLGTGGQDFRTISKVMTDAEFSMNHATARNQLMLAMENLFNDMAKQLGTKLNKKQIDEMLHNQIVHNALAEILYRAYSDLKKEGKIEDGPAKN